MSENISGDFLSVIKAGVAALGGTSVSDSILGALHELVALLGVPAPAAPVGAAPLVLDSFTRADDATHLGTADSGQAWTVTGAGSMGIASNQAAYNGNTGVAFALIDAGRADVYMEVQALINFSDIVLRSTPAGASYLVAQYNGSAIGIGGGTGGGGAGGTNGTITVALSASDTLAFVCYGASFLMFKNGVPIQAYTDGAVPRLAATLFGFHGLGLGGFNEGWDNLVIRALDRFPQVVCDGDSLTLGTGLGNANQPYPEQLVLSLAKVQGWPWIFRNFGIFGQPATLMVVNGATKIDALYGSGHVKNVVSFWAGTNDLNLAPGGAAGVYATLKKYWADRRAAGWQVLAYTLTPRSDGGASVSHEADRIALNTLIKSDATLYDKCVDLGADPTIGAPGASANATYFQDGLHLTAAGYTIVAGLAKAAIAAL